VTDWVQATSREEMLRWVDADLDEPIQRMGTDDLGRDVFANVAHRPSR